MQGWDEGFISSRDSGDDVYVDMWCLVGGGGALTFEIKLVDVFQRLVDKEETSESLKEEKYL